MTLLVSCFVVALGAVLGACSGGSSTTASTTPGGSTSQTGTSPDLKPLLLDLTDLPAGWLLSSTKSSGSLGAQQGCPAFDAVDKIRDSDSVQFTQSARSDLPQLAEALGWSPSASAVFQAGLAEIGQCKHLSLTSGSVSTPATVTPIAFPRMGSQSAAYQLSIEVDGIAIDFDIVFARQGDYLSLLALGSVGPPQLSQLEQVVRAALAKLPR